jgi:16S rRNA (uracil1498-N3)-methyltransferase
MKAILLPSLDITADRILIEDEKYHHLIRVMRSEVNEKIIILNGSGLVINGEIISISKKDAVIKANNSIQNEDTRRINVYAGIPKSDTLDFSIRQIVEMGVKSLTLVQTEYSQGFRLKTDRFFKIVESAMIQSNNPFMLGFPEVLSFDAFLEKAKIEKILSLMEPKYTSNSPLPLSLNFEALMIGPEGGYSQAEAKSLAEYTTPITIKLPIMRFETALPFALGMIYPIN